MEREGESALAAYVVRVAKHASLSMRSISSDFCMLFVLNETVSMRFLEHSSFNWNKNYSYVSHFVYAHSEKLYKLKRRETGKTLSIKIFKSVNVFKSKLLILIASLLLVSITPQYNENNVNRYLTNISRF